MSIPGWLDGTRIKEKTGTRQTAMQRRGVEQIGHPPDPCNSFTLCTACVAHREVYCLSPPISRYITHLPNKQNLACSHTF